MTDDSPVEKKTMQQLSEHSVRIRGVEILKADLEWTKKFFESKFEDLEKRTEQARVGMEKRLDSMNEFREALKDQSAKSPTRIEIDTKIDALEKDIRLLNSFKDALEGKASQSDVNNARLIGYIGIAIGVIGLVRGFF